MSGQDLFDPATVQDVINKLSTGQVLPALDQVLSNDLVIKIAANRQQIAEFQKQIAYYEERIVAKEAEYIALLSPPTSTEKE